jgi:hypothetical protein
MLWTICHKCRVDGHFVHLLGTISVVLGWTGSPSTFMFAWDAVLQWTLCSWVTKYSVLYMLIEVSLGQGIHGQFIIAP